VRGAVAISAPIDLRAAQQRIMQPRNALYHRHLLRQMKQDAQRAGYAHVTADLLARVRSVYDFDDLIVAPANGFTSADDYYARCSAAPRLGGIARPTIVIHAADDPWIQVVTHMAQPWPTSGHATLVVTPSGGHVGFHDESQTFPWHDVCAGRFINSLATWPRN
jgi:predicted alpha/beta-fold hydrolase